MSPAYPVADPAGTIPPANRYLLGDDLRMAENSRLSAPPYTIRTGYDDNGDLLFNDRPVGVGRNSARAASMLMSYASIGYVISFGTKRVPTGQGVLLTSGGGGRTVDLLGGQSIPRYRLTLTLGAQNATNHANYIGYSGIMTSPFFGKPTAVSNMRRITMVAGMSL